MQLISALDSYKATRPSCTEEVRELALKENSSQKLRYKMGKNKVSIVCQNLGGCPSKMNVPNYLGIWPPSSQGSKDRIDAIPVPFGWDLILFTGLVSTDMQKYNVNLAHRGHKRAPVPLPTGGPPQPSSAH